MRMSDWSSDLCSSDLRSLWRCHDGLFHRARPPHGDVTTRRSRSDKPQHSLPDDARAWSGGTGKWSRANPAVTIPKCAHGRKRGRRSEEHTSELQSLMRISYAVFCLKKKNNSTRPRNLHVI